MAAKAKQPKQSSQRRTVADVVAFAAAVIYLQSVLTVAHHTSKWEHSGTTHTVEGPAITLLVISLVVCVYSWKRFGRNLSALNIVTLTVLVVSTLFWWLGLRVNFFF